MKAQFHSIPTSTSQALLAASLMSVAMAQGETVVPQRVLKETPQLPAVGTLAESAANIAPASSAILTPPAGMEEVRRAEIAPAPTPRPSYPEPDRLNKTVSYSTPLQPERPLSPLLPETSASGAVPSAADREEQSSQPDKNWKFTIEARFVFDDNIYLASDRALATGRGKVSDTVILLAPAITWQTGDVTRRKNSYASASYSPSVSYFTGGTAETAVDHNLKVDVQKRWGRLAAGVEGKFQHLTGATAELSDRVERNEYGARVHASYQLSDRTSIEGGAAYLGTDYQDAGLSSYDEFLADATAFYALTGDTRVGAGLAAGSLEADGFDTQTYQRALLRAETTATGNLSFNVSGGVELRDTAAGSATTPVYKAGAEWRVADGTKASLNVFREVTASGSLAGQNVTRTGTSVKLEQRIGSRLTAGVDVGYENLKYTDAGSNSKPGAVKTADRADDYLFVKPSLRYEFMTGRRAEFYYSLRKDDSSISDFDFESNQVGLALGLDF